MSLKKQIKMEIGGDYLKGTIINDLYHSSSLVNAIDNRNGREVSRFNVSLLKEIINELQELVDIMEANNVAKQLHES